MSQNLEKLAKKMPRNEVVREIAKSCNAHVKRYGIRKMSLAELDELCNIKEYWHISALDMAPSRL